MHDTCPASECTLFCKDLWLAGRRRIYMNPAVTLTYNANTEMLQRTVMRWFNTFVFPWAHSLGSPRWPGAGRTRGDGSRAADRHTSPSFDAEVAVPWDDRSWSDGSPSAWPQRVSCGLAGEDYISTAASNTMGTQARTPPGGGSGSAHADRDQPDRDTAG